MEDATATISSTGDAVRIQMAATNEQNDDDKASISTSSPQASGAVTQLSSEPSSVSQPTIDILPMTSGFSRLITLLERSIADPIRRRFPNPTNKTSAPSTSTLHHHFSPREGICIGVAVCLTLAAIGLILSVTVGRPHTIANLLSSRKAFKEVCLDYNCFKSSAVIQKKMNTSVSPCQNFYQYACGGWTGSQTLNGNENYRSVLQLMAKENVRRIKDAISAKTSIYRNTTWAFEKKVKTYYDTCTDQFYSTVISKLANPIVGQIRKMGGWYVTGSYSAFNMTRALANVLGHDNLIDVFFYYDIEPLDQQHRQYYITIREDFNLPLPYDRWSRNDLVNAYRKFIRKVGDYLSKDSFSSDSQSGNRLDDFVNDVISVERALARIQMLNIRELANPRAIEKTIYQLERTSAPAFKWLYFFRTCLSEAGISFINSRTKITIHTPKILKATMNLLVQNTFSSRQLNNYLVWRLAYGLLPDMPYQYNHLWLDWSERVYGRTKEYRPIWDVCFRRVASFMSEAVGGMFARQYFGHYNKAQLRQIVEALRSTMFIEIQQLTWMDQATRKTASEKINHVLEKIGFPDHMDSELKMQNALDYEYKDITVSQFDHYGNSQSLRQYFRKRMIRILTSGRDWSSDWRETPFYSVRASYFAPWNEMIVPAGFLQFPIYSSANPTMYRSQIYGSAAVRFAKGYVFAIDEDGSWFNKFGDWPEDWWSNKTYHSYLNLKKCYTDWYGEVQTKPIAFESDPKPRKLSDPENYATRAIAEVGSLRNAFLAYRNDVLQNYSLTVEDKLIPGVKSSSFEEYFFLAYAQTLCAVRSDENVYLKMQLSQWLPEELSVNNALAQLKEFSDVFKCQSGSPMNPTNRCDIIF